VLGLYIFLERYVSLVCADLKGLLMGFRTTIASPPRGSPSSQVPARDGDLNEEAVPTPARPTQGEAAVTEEKDAGNGPASANPSSPSISRPKSDETPDKDEVSNLSFMLISDD